MATLLQALPQTPTDVLKFQRDMLRLGKVEHLGQIWKIVFEATRDSNVPDKSETEKLGLTFDFHDGSGCEGGVRPMIGRYGSMMIIETPLKRKDGHAGLPDIPDPAWKPRALTHDEITGVVPYHGQQTAMKKQEFGERAAGLWKGTNFAIFEVVAQILVLPEGLPEGWLFSGRSDVSVTPASHPSLLVDLRTGEGFFYGGIYGDPLSPRGGGTVTV